MSVRVVPASEAADLRRQHQEDFMARFLGVMGYPLAEDEARRWWPE